MGIQENLRRAVIVAGSRIPFQRSLTGYSDLVSYDLGRLALKGLLYKTQIDGNTIDRVIVGCVIQDVQTSNVAREIVLGAGLPKKIPAYTVTMACISANMAITNAVDLIRTGQADVVIAGGTDTMSEVPIRCAKSLRRKLLMAQKFRTTGEFLRFFFGLRPRDFFPELPGINEFSVGLSMGQSCQRLVTRIGVSRQEQDEYALRSHLLAAKATESGILAEEISEVRLPKKFNTIDKDNGFRADSTLEKLQALKPAFDKKYGTITAGNSSFPTDGAAMVLLMAEEVAKACGYSPKAYVHSYEYTAHDVLEDLLLGPAYAVPKVLDKAGLSISDIGVFEFHEAFAGQIVSVLKSLDCDKFARENLGKDKKVGEVPIDKLNTLGGSLSLGHPFGATGARLVTTAVNRLSRENAQFALVSGCAGGAMASAILLERC